MRTTLTLDDDVAAALEQLRKSRNVSLKDLINEALRQGLKSVEQPWHPHQPAPSSTFRTTETAQSGCSQVLTESP
jgi:hypothetical protein